MGLGVVERLLDLGWNVAIVDFDEKAAIKATERLGEKTFFVKANVIIYEEQANAFVQTFNKWHRIDLVYANAGIGDRIDFYAPATEVMANGAPKKPDSLVVDICLYGCIWTSYLALHYFRMNPDGIGKIVMTSSMCGIYLGDKIPLYTAAKHGVSSYDAVTGSFKLTSNKVVGLTRSMARRLASLGGNVTVNCVCPGQNPALSPNAMGPMLILYRSRTNTPRRYSTRSLPTRVSNPYCNRSSSCRGFCDRQRDHWEGCRMQWRECVL
jgi:15-hydroxyprostaglandin dehydrogenase (NAD)